VIQANFRFIIHETSPVLKANLAEKTDFCCELVFFFHSRIDVDHGMFTGGKIVCSKSNRLEKGKRGLQRFS
jgi:hypothetical protein